MPRGYRSAAHFGRKRGQRTGFTLVEMLVAVVILLILMGIIFQIIQMVSQAYSKSSQGTTSMQQARVAFERMTRTISQATLNTYYDYIDANGHWPSNPAYTLPPANYGRQSELQFVSGNGPVGGATPFINSTVGHATQVTHAVFFSRPSASSAPLTHRAMETSTASSTPAVISSSTIRTRCALVS